MTDSNRQAIEGTYSDPNENPAPGDPDAPDTDEPTEGEPTVPAEPPTTPGDES